MIPDHHPVILISRVRARESEPIERRDPAAAAIARARFNAARKLVSPRNNTATGKRKARKCGQRDASTDERRDSPKFAR